VAATVPDGNTRRAAPTLSDADEMSGVARVDVAAIGSGSFRQNADRAVEALF
jgi:hypothetical protein